MAVTESRPAPHDGESPARDGPGRARRHPWRRRILLGLGLLLTAAVVVLAVLAGTYQPIRFGDTYGGDFPGLPHGTGLRSVNTFAGATGGDLRPAAVRRVQRDPEHLQRRAAVGDHRGGLDLVPAAAGRAVAAARAPGNPPGRPRRPRPPRPPPGSRVSRRARSRRAARCAVAALSPGRAAGAPMTSGCYLSVIAASMTVNDRGGSRTAPSRPSGLPIPLPVALSPRRAACGGRRGGPP